MALAPKLQGMGFAVESATEEAERLEHVILAGFTHEPVVALSERLAALTDNRLGH